ncbi:Putative tRNA-specific adenosine deaminase [Blumeria hordei DH14]|uniref:Putative tRNA-specific adenosine deaminase n=1 Tax=Blumeria graminis f. sp. hordei (strain DH14) TaxID=546991 RepID=N1JBH8_BLUG1|nr:Putative tRNA-specific adenosine deaminase [Blumeria hordei DH14]
MKNTNIADAIANVVLEEFAKWPAKRKPLKRSEGKQEWVPLSGIFTINSTGMKCLPQNKINQAQGNTLHDWHAEILVIRSFNRFLLEECFALVTAAKTSSDFIRLRNPEEITISHPPANCTCTAQKLLVRGDASMELTIAAQEDSTPWNLPSTSKQVRSHQSLLDGRSYFSQLGTIRRKPSRPDAPPTLSKSCSDKLALKQCTSLLSSVASIIISPENLYIKSLVIPKSQMCESACNRAFSVSGRLAPLKNKILDKPWIGGYQFSPFLVLPTSLEFTFSRRRELLSSGSLVPSNLASFSTINGSGTLIGGTLQGRKQFSLKGYVRNTSTESLLNAATYFELKQCDSLINRRAIKSMVRGVLGGNLSERGWVPNLGGEEWPLHYSL